MSPFGMVPAGQPLWRVWDDAPRAHVNLPLQKNAALWAILAPLRVGDTFVAEGGWGPDTKTSTATVTAREDRPGGFTLTANMGAWTLTVHLRNHD